MRILNPNISLLLKPFFILSVTIVLLSYLIKTGYAKVTEQINKYQKAQQSRNDLNEKIKTLREVKEGVLGKGDRSVLALPDKNSTIWVITQLKANSQEVGATLDKIDLIGTTEKEGVMQVDLEVVVSGPNFESLLTFLSNIAKSAPITTISSVTFEKAQGKEEISAKIELSSYWSSLPKVLPPIAEPVVGLTDKEKDILSRISDLKTPTFTVLEPSAPIERSEPFN